MSEQAVAHAWNGKKPQDTLTLMSEPEAAAETVYRLLRFELRVGDGILICDCGGGTVVCILSFLCAGARLKESKQG